MLLPCAFLMSLLLSFLFPDLYQDCMQPKRQINCLQLKFILKRSKLRPGSFSNWVSTTIFFFFSHPWRGLQACLCLQPARPVYPGLHQQRAGSEQGGDCPHLFCPCEAPSAVLQSRHRPPVQAGCGAVGVGPEEGHKDAQRSGAPLLWRQAEDLIVALRYVKGAYRQEEDWFFTWW